MAITKISKHISYKEATHSNTATRRGIKNLPSDKHIVAMKSLAKNVFEPVRVHFDKPIRVNSFFRSVALNKAIGGSSTSQHCKGEAIDLDATKGFTNKQIYNYIKDNLEFDQLIWEFGTDKEPDWVHVSYRADGKNRKQQLRASRKGGKSVYTVIATTKPQEEKPKKTTKLKTKGVVKVATNLNVRAKGNKTAKIVGSLPNKTKVTITKTKNDWHKIKAGKIVGWVFAKYVKI
ncbi:MAG: D-Ala-D-Ala carboxypeptidase family metallohydrolase [Vicingaceae bacterium]|nr:D-Ala-D-Ala carboxypeptidase family metallohydrolase [Vicingaceae bacterium]